MVTNVSPHDLNYDSYSTQKYDSDIVNVIPGYLELHSTIKSLLEKSYSNLEFAKILDVGVGTRITSEIVLKLFPSAKLVAIDFSKQMLSGAKKRLARYNPDLVFGDFSVMPIGKNYDLILSVLAIHHQKSAKDKQALFKKIFLSLNQGGLFIFGDLFNFKSKKETALNDALHYHHLVENAVDKKSLEEWAFHHEFLNSRDALESQIDWIKEAGFRKVEINFRKYNTVLIFAWK